MPVSKVVKNRRGAASTRARGRGDKITACLHQRLPQLRGRGRARGRTPLKRDGRAWFIMGQLAPINHGGPRMRKIQLATLASACCALGGCAANSGVASRGRMMRIIAVGVVLVLAACQSVSQVTPAGSGNYMVGASVRGGFASWAEVKALTLNRATEYCDNQGKDMVAIDSATHGARGWTPQDAELTFRCVDRAKPA